MIVSLSTRQITELIRLVNQETKNENIVDESYGGFYGDIKERLQTEAI